MDGSTASVTAVNESMTAVETMELVRNETNGTVVGVRRKPNPDDNASLVYEVSVLQADQTKDDQADINRRVVTAEVDATERTVISVEQESGSDALLGGDEDEVPTQSRKLTTTRSAVEAANVALDDSRSENRTVNAVDLTLTDNTTNPLVYAINVENTDDEVRLLVSARKGESGIIGVEPQTGDDESGD